VSLFQWVWLLHWPIWHFPLLKLHEYNAMVISEYWLQKMRKVAVVSSVHVLSQHVPGWTEETARNFTQDSRFPGQNLNPAFAQYDARFPPILQLHSVPYCLMCGTVLHRGHQCGIWVYHRCSSCRWVKRQPRINLLYNIYCRYREHTNELQLEDLQVAGWWRSPFC
jgi:hypothetical protein